MKNLGKNVDSNLKCVGLAVCSHPNSSYTVICCSHYISTVFIQIEAQVSISSKGFLTQHLNESGIYLDPGIYFLLFAYPG